MQNATDVQYIIYRSRKQYFPSVNFFNTHYFFWNVRKLGTFWRHPENSRFL
jgi:hypothetical protein